MSEVFWVDGDGNMKCNSIISAQFNNHEGLVISNGLRIGVLETVTDILEPQVGAILVDVEDVWTNIDGLSTATNAQGALYGQLHPIVDYLVEHVGFIPDLLELSTPSKTIVGEIVALKGSLVLCYKQIIILAL